MFNRVLVSAPSEQFPRLALKRAAEMKELMGSRIYLSYIIEDNVFDEVSDQIGHVLTEKEGDKFQKKMEREHRKMARKVVLKEAERILGIRPKDFLVQKGSFSETLTDTINENDIDLLMMEYESFNLIKYRIMDRSPVPVWIERKEGPIKKIGLFCSNLSPNEHSPSVARSLMRAFSAKLDPYYIVDPKGRGDGEEAEILAGENRLKWNEVAREKVDSFIYGEAKEEEFDLIILGRIKKRGYFHMRSKFAKRTDCSVLMIN
ncbi:MAG: universal stress protein [Thermoplasmatota archaeon]